MTELKPNNRNRKWLIGGAVAAVVVLSALLLAASKRTAQPARTTRNLMTFSARRDNLTVMVSESGSIKAKTSTELKSGVEGRATISKIVPEGTYVTQQDVDSNVILIELDAGDLREQLAQREIDYASAEASYAEAKEAYDIQVKQNESDISEGQLNVKFALMDFQKYLGASLAKEIVARAEQIVDPNIDVTTVVDMNTLFGNSNDDPNSGEEGEAWNLFKQRQDDIVIADENLRRAGTTLTWTQRLREKGYISQTQLESDELTMTSCRIRLEQARAELELFKSYDFPKVCQQRLSNYYEAKRELDRRYAKARAQLSQSKARLESARSRFNLNQDRLEKAKKQVVATTMRAPSPGLVTYGSPDEDFRHWRGEVIAVGQQVSQQQTIITLPNTAEMVAEISVHESSVDKVRPGQKATIVMDAFPDKVLHGEVLKVAPLPDTSRNFLSPDVKVYKTQVSIEGTHDYLKPGMSARVDIMAAQLTDVIIVPVQVVANRAGSKVCYVYAGGTKERRVETGEFNDTYVQITSGLEEGEEVLLNPPRITETKEENARQTTDRREQQGEKGQPLPQQARRAESAQPAMEGPPAGFDVNQISPEMQERMRQFRQGQGQGPPDFNQLDEETRNRIRQMRGGRRQRQSDDAGSGPRP